MTVQELLEELQAWLDEDENNRTLEVYFQDQEMNGDAPVEDIEQNSVYRDGKFVKVLMLS